MKHIGAKFLSAALILSFILTGCTNGNLKNNGEITELPLTEKTTVADNYNYNTKDSAEKLLHKTYNLKQVNSSAANKNTFLPYTVRGYTTHDYPRWQIPSITDITTYTDLNCLRKNGEFTYSVHKMKNQNGAEGYGFVIYNRDVQLGADNDDKYTTQKDEVKKHIALRPVDFWFVSTVIEKDNFLSKIKTGINATNLEEVRKLDPNTVAHGIDDNTFFANRGDKDKKTLAQSEHRFIDGTVVLLTYQKTNREAAVQNIQTYVDPYQVVRNLFAMDLALISNTKLLPFANESDKKSLFTNSGDNAVDLLTKTYLLEDFIPYTHFPMYTLSGDLYTSFYKIGRMHRQFPIECLRKNGDFVYSIHKYKKQNGQEGYCFMQYGFTQFNSNDTKVRRLVDIWFVSAIPNKNNLKKVLQKGVAFEDVAKADPDTILFEKINYSNQSNLVTQHRFADGERANVYYKRESGKTLVHQVEYENDSSGFVKNILPIDLYLLK